MTYPVPSQRVVVLYHSLGIEMLKPIITKQRCFTHTHIHTCIHVYIHARTCTHTYTHTYTHTRTHTHVYIHIHIYVHTHIHNTQRFSCKVFYNINTQSLNQQTVVNSSVIKHSSYSDNSTHLVCNYFLSKTTFHHLCQYLLLTLSLSGQFSTSMAKSCNIILCSKNTIKNVAVKYYVNREWNNYPLEIRYTKFVS